MAEITSPVVEFVYAPGGQHPLASMNGQNLGAVYVPLPGGAFAIYNGSGVYQYNHPDFLGSAKLFSTPTRSASAAMAYAPFGEGYTGGQQWEQFTTWGDAFTMYYNEGQTGTLDDFTFRRYSPVQGRWISPDPAGLGAVNPANPQSWNRYAYVGNAPLTGTDPSGLFRSDNVGTEEDNRDFANSSTYYLNGMQVSGTTAGTLIGGTFTNFGSTPFIGSNSASNGQSYSYELVANDEGSGYAYFGADYGTAKYELGLPTDQSGSANNGPTNSVTTPPCQAKILNATNNRFGTNYTNANVNSTFNYSTGAPPGQGTLNLNVFGSTAGVSPGYYPVHWWTYAIGYGPTLHAVSGPGGNGGLDSTQTLQFGPNQATFHIDSGFPYNPSGAFFHWLLNMTKAGGYPQC
jgi:RHS repeat-associated protein